MALHIHRAERADTLADVLASMMSPPLPDPFAAEVVAVPAKGVERWLTQRLSRVLGAAGGDGISANITFPTPAALVAGVLAEATGIAVADDPWAAERVVWTLLRVLDAALSEPWCAVPARHLGAGDARSHRSGRRFATAARIAALYETYASQRPELLRAWASGAPATDLPDDLRWQCLLWQRLRAELGTPGPAERLAAACARLRAEPSAVDLPHRLSLFGVSRLAADQLAVLSALAAHRDVHLWLTHPSPAMWAALHDPLVTPDAVSDARVSAVAEVDATSVAGAPGRIGEFAAAGAALGAGPVERRRAVAGVAPRHADPAEQVDLGERVDPADAADTRQGAGAPGGAEMPCGAHVSGAAGTLGKPGVPGGTYAPPELSGIPNSAEEVESAVAAEISGIAESVRPAGEPPADSRETTRNGAPEIDGGRIPLLGPVRATDRSALAVAHPLLAALGRDVRELQQRLAVLGPVRGTHHHVVSESGSRTVLSAVQAGLRDDSWPPARRVPADGSVQVHSCHGPARQVEVLRDVLLGEFAADPTLQPRDVVVLCPDVDSYAPLLRAAFGQSQADAAGAAAHPGHLLRVRPADRSQGSANPVFTVLEQVLGLADGRVTVTEVLDLAASEPVRLRCGFDDDDIERLREWAAETGARWGIGQRQRQAFGLDDFAQNTLNAAVDRILLGVAAGESSEDWLDLALPLDDVDSGDVDLAGRFAEFVDRLAVCVRDLRGPTPAEPAGSERPASEWQQVLTRILELLTDVPRAQAWQAAEVRRDLVAVLEHAGDIPLRLPDIAALLRSRLSARSTRANFRTGELTVCGLAPLRSVPHRVVVLLGLDDDVFPRAGGIDGDDILAREPRVGDRDARSEDRQLLLDAITAAQERLIVLYTGADPVTGAYRPPAIPLAELLDAVRAHLTDTAAAALVTRHPLQAFDRRNFEAAHPMSFDTVALAGAHAAAHPVQRPPEFLPGPLPAAAVTDVELAELISFVEHPVRAFLWQRLGIRVPEEDEEIDQRLPIELDGLTKWNMGERMLSARLTGVDPATLRAAEWRRGTLPPFGLGAAVLDEVEDTVDRLVRVAQPMHEIPSRTIDVAVDLGDGRLLSGTVPDVHDDAVVRTTFSRLAPKHRMAAWVRVLALAATERNRGWRAVTMGRGRFGRPAWRSTLTAPNAALAQQILRDLADLRDSGLAAPLPVAPTASALYAERRAQGATVEDARFAADQEFLGGPNGPKAFGDHTDRYLRYVWGPAPRLENLENPLAEPDPHGEPTTFAATARRLWHPLLTCESQGQP
ncbi:exodeoxyribonuclease V subunit gamma [Nocardia aurantia]|uniref:RecBCD enzyme subunit RecC n=1 Tax=Nocardia aurantia TaxID=2585199 RepID=A0A7K0DKV3_9NOCA|nr:exodeoxyribonuclease V subunit gamma [Nocardia aurantia]MQY26298.1 RecBCD enzyme subunit RecC [Nocardia aurantia]